MSFPDKEKGKRIPSKKFLESLKKTTYNNLFILKTPEIQFNSNVSTQVSPRPCKKGWEKADLTMPNV